MPYVIPDGVQQVLGFMCMLHAASACEFHMQFALVGAVIGFIQREERLLDIGTSSVLAEIGVIESSFLRCRMGRSRNS